MKATKGASVRAGATAAGRQPPVSKGKPINAKHPVSPRGPKVKR
jgi:hypothetical protein